MAGKLTAGAVEPATLTFVLAADFSQRYKPITWTDRVQINWYSCKNRILFLTYCQCFSCKIRYMVTLIKPTQENWLEKISPLILSSAIRRNFIKGFLTFMCWRYVSQMFFWGGLSWRNSRNIEQIYFQITQKFRIRKLNITII